MESTAEIAGLKALIKETMREVLQEERILLCKLLMPYVSNEEQAEIETQFGLPDDAEAAEWIDMTEWIKHGGSISQASI
jgi:hypothetical protein